MPGCSCQGGATVSLQSEEQLDLGESQCEAASFKEWELETVKNKNQLYFKYGLRFNYYIDYLEKSHSTLTLTNIQGAAFLFFTDAD